MCDVVNVTDVVDVVLQHAIVLSCNSPYRSGHLQKCIQKLTIPPVHIKVVSIANKSCLFQVMHTKAITALMQFCDLFVC